MKKIKNILVCTLALSFVVSGCKKSFLDREPSQNITPEQIAAAAKQDPAVLKGLVSGLYSTMYNTGTGGTTGHDDFGQKGYDIYSDMLASDVVLGALNYGWYSTVIRYQATKDFTLLPAYAPFRYYYRIIFAANNIIEILGGNDAVPANATLKSYMGQAKAMRAYAYFYLVQFYTDKGYGTGAEKSLPLFIDTQSQGGKALSTTSVIYDQGIKDLNEAITLLTGYTRANKGEVNVDVAKGLLAYYYASRGTAADLDNVITLTDGLLTTWPLTTQTAVVAQLDGAGKLLNPTSGFNNVATPSWIWGTDLILASNLDLISWWGQMDIFTYSYAWAGDPKFIDASLYASIRTDDSRKAQFTNFPGYGGLVPTGKFFDPARVEGGQRSVITDYVYFRADEFLLLNAETKARQGKDAEARAALKKLTAVRFTNPTAYNAVIDGLSGAALLEEIYQQTRIELWGEGKVYLAMKRLKHGITRGANHLFFAGTSYAYDADELTFPIPQAEVINNSNISK